MDAVITDFLEKNTSGERPLDFHATVDPEEAYSDADFAVIATPTNYDEKKNYFDTSSVEAAISAVRKYAPEAWIIIKSTIPVGYTQQLRDRLNDDHILFSPEFLREGHALNLDNLHPQPYCCRCSAGDARSVEARTYFVDLLAREHPPEERSRVIMMAVQAFQNWWWALPRPKPSNCLPTRILRCVWLISMSLTLMLKAAD